MKDKNNKCIAVLIALLIILVIDLGIGIHHISNYSAQKEAGNARWRQVEQRIIQIENKVRDLEIKIK